LCTTPTYAGDANMASGQNKYLEQNIRFLDAGS
jgi:hypothetical protein